jgi:hypothetical protein
MKPKRSETATETINRWSHELLTSTAGRNSAFPEGRPLSDMSVNDFDRALEMVEWLRARLEVLKVQNT